VHLALPAVLQGGAWKLDFRKSISELRERWRGVQRCRSAASSPCWRSRKSWCRMTMRTCPSLRYRQLKLMLFYISDQWKFLKTKWVQNNYRKILQTLFKTEFTVRKNYLSKLLWDFKDLYILFMFTLRLWKQVEWGWSVSDGRTGLCVRKEAEGRGRVSRGHRRTSIAAGRISTGWRRRKAGSELAGRTSTAGWAAAG